MTTNYATESAVPINPGEMPDQKTRERIALDQEQAAFGTDSGDLVRVWDNIDESWSSPMARDNLVYVLRMVTVVCSACNFTSSGEEHTIRTHVNQTLEQVEAHREATFTDVVTDGTLVKTCSGCGNQFLMRKRQHERHLEKYSDNVGKAHESAEARYVKRYSTAPPATVEAHTNGNLKVMPKTVPLAAEIGSPRRVPGRRRRGRRGGRRN